MRAFTASRNADTRDALWPVEHPPVYTLGQAARDAHLPRGVPAAGPPVPIERVDRGGQITYHGPGQVVLYTLLDLRRRGLKIGELVRLLEQTAIDFLAGLDIAADRRDGAPGVYVAGRKIAALGLRVRNGCCYHGLALNCDMDLGPFDAIDPCGYPGLEVTQLRDLGVQRPLDAVADDLSRHFLGLLDAR